MADIRAQFRFGAIIIGFVSTLSGCTKPNNSHTIELDQAFKTRLGQLHITPNRDFAFKISKIVEDSRGICGKNNVCVWDGQLILQLEYSHDPESETNNYRNVLQFREEVFEGYAIQLLKVNPKRQPENHKKYHFIVEVKQVNID